MPVLASGCPMKKKKKKKNKNVLVKAEWLSLGL